MSFVYQKLPRLPKSVLRVFKVCCLCFLLVMDNFALENAKVVDEQKELDNLVQALGEDRLPLQKSCMEGTRTAILHKIEDEIKNVNGPNMFWIRGSPDEVYFPFLSSLLLLHF